MLLDLKVKPNLVKNKTNKGMKNDWLMTKQVL